MSLPNGTANTSAMFVRRGTSARVAGPIGRLFADTSPSHPPSTHQATPRSGDRARGGIVRPSCARRNRKGKRHANRNTSGGATALAMRRRQVDNRAMSELRSVKLIVVKAGERRCPWLCIRLTCRGGNDP